MRIVVPGDPVPKGRPRRARAGNWYTPPVTREYEERVAWHARSLRHSFGAGMVSVTAHFFLAPGKKLGDGDNYLKAVLDGCEKGGLVDNDKSVVDGRFVLHTLAETPRTEILIFSYPNDNDNRVWCRGQLVSVVDEGGRSFCTGCGDDVSSWAVLA